MSHPWEIYGETYPRRDARHYLPRGGYTFSATETYAAKARSRLFLLDRESLHVRQLPFTRGEVEKNGIDWNTIH